MEPETQSIDGDVRLPSSAGDCTLPQRQLRGLPLPSDAVVAIGAVRAVEQADQLAGQVSRRSLVVSTCERQSAVEESDDRSAIVVKVASPTPLAKMFTY